ncbi:ribonucleoside hydrolase RihC, partial [Staphylococcus cohnii]
IYDAYTILYLLHPELFQIVEARVDIETTGELTRGATVTDLKSAYPNCTVVMGIETDIFEKIFFDALTYCK